METTQAHNLSGSFWLAHQRCMEKRPLPNGQFQFPAVPAIICAAFSTEIGFKAIILSEGGQAFGHKLAELFGMLSPASQNFIITDTGVDRTTFDQSLQSVSNAFVEWRYVYEKQNAQVNIDFLSRLAAATQKASARVRGDS